MRILKVVGLVALSLMVIVVVAVLVLASRADAKLTARDTPYPAVTATKDPAVIARGAYLARTVAHCSQCHGAYERAHPEGNTADVALSGGFEFPMGPMGTLYAANLTSDPETGIGARTDGELARAIAHGVLPDGRLSIFMRYSASNLSQEDLTAIISYLRSLPPVKHAVPKSELSVLGKAMFGMFDVTPDLAPLPQHVAESDEPSIERGAYLAEHVALCVACHSNYDPSTFLPTGPKAAGSPPDPSPGDDSDMEFVAPNLTSHPTGMTGKLDEDQFVARVRQGRAFPSSKMPWESFSRMSEPDVRSIYRYLRSLPPIENDVGPTYREKGWEKR